MKPEIGGLIGSMIAITVMFFLMPFWIMAVAKTLFNLDWRVNYWTIIQLQLIIGWLTNHNNFRVKL